MSLGHDINGEDYTGPDLPHHIYVLWHRLQWQHQQHLQRPAD